MQRLRGLGVLIFVASAACAAPEPIIPTTPALPPAPIVNGLKINGLPSRLTEGQSVQLTASVILPGGVEKQAPDVAWQSSDDNVATISPSGMVRVVGGGPADIKAAAYGQAASTSLRALFRISGVVQEPALNDSAPVAGARVEVQGGAQSGTSAITDGSGRFTLDVESAGVELVVTRHDYEAARTSIAQLPRDQSPTIALTPAAREVFFSRSGFGRDLPCEFPIGNLLFPTVTSFSAYHSGRLVVSELVHPGWTHKGLILDKFSADGRPISRTRIWSQGQAIPFSVEIEGGYKYSIGLDAELIISDRPFSVILTHPR